MARVVIAAGGTAGHVVPALAVADALRAEGATVTFAGTRERAEAELVPAAGYEIDYLAVRGLDRRHPLRAAGAALRAASAIGVGRRLLRRRRADVVLGGGGYVAGPVAVAALTLGRPIVLTEADSHLGLTNRLLARRARRVCLAFPIPGREGDPYLLTGRPVPEAVLRAERHSARRRYGVSEHARCLLVVGGSLGARTINEAAFAAFSGAEAGTTPPGTDDGFHLLHVSGRRDFAGLRERLGDAPRPGYTLIESEPNLGDALAACDLVLARAGGSVLEIAAAGRPAILVPYPHATGQHQATNARWMADAGAAIVIEDRELSAERIAAEVADLLSDRPRLERMAAASLALARPDAAQRIAAEVLEAARA